MTEGELASPTGATESYAPHVPISGVFKKTKITLLFVLWCLCREVHIFRVKYKILRVLTTQRAYTSPLVPLGQLTTQWRAPTDYAKRL